MTYRTRQWLVVDQNYDEERVMETKVIVSMNVHREICALQYTGGVALSPDQVCCAITTATSSNVSDIKMS